MMTEDAEAPRRQRAKQSKIQAR